MKTISLYLFLALSVLFVTGCGEDEAQQPPQEAVQALEERTQRAEPEGRAEARQVPETSAETVVLVLGNSLAAGAGVDPSEAFPALLQERVDSLGWDVEVINAGLSGETSAGGLRRIDWLLRRPADVLILELGGNDGLRGIPIEDTRANLAGIIEKARAKNPEMRIILAGMQIPPNLGHDYTQRFRALYPELAAAHDTELIPFLLEDVGGVPELMQGDGIHPTAEGQRIVARNVWEILGPVLASMRQPS